METSIERPAWWILIDLAIGILITVVAYAGLTIVALPGVVPAFLLQWLAVSVWECRARGESSLCAAFDADEIPGPAAWVLGTVIAWWLIVHGVRRAVWASRRRRTSVPRW